MWPPGVGMSPWRWVAIDFAAWHAVAAIVGWWPARFYGGAYGSATVRPGHGREP